MVQYNQTRCDAAFAALSDATRRGVLEQLGRADASITDLANKFHMTLTGMKKHVGVLEQAGLVTTEKVGRVRTCKLGQRRLEEEAAWIARYRKLWAARFDAVDEVVAELSYGISFLSCEADVRAGGTYRFVFGHPAAEQPMTFFGKYIEVTPHTRLVWSNEESDEGVVTTVTFAEKGAVTLVVVHDLYPSKEALDAAIASGSTGGAGEQFAQLDALLVTLT